MTLKKPLLSLVFFATCLFFCTLLPHYSHAQPRHVIKINALDILKKTYGIGYEFVINEQISISMLGAIKSIKTGSLETERYSTAENGWQIIPQLRYYLKSDENAPTGIFLGLGGFYESLQVQANQLDSTTNTITYKSDVYNKGPGLIGGFQWIMNKQFSLELMAMPYYNFATEKGNINEGNIKRYGIENRLMLKLGFSLGVAF